MVACTGHGRPLLRCLPRLRSPAKSAGVSAVFCLTLTAACCVGLAGFRLLTGAKPGIGGDAHRGSGGCAEVLEQVMRAAGWRGYQDAFWLRLTHSALLAEATKACLLAQLPADGGDDEVQAPDRHCFAEKLTLADREKSMRHLSLVASELEGAGIQYYLDMGTALGAFRHFEMIPYDEDIDVRINAEQKEAAKAVLRRLRYTWPELLFQDTEWANQHWKVHFMDTMDPVLERHVALDVFFYTANQTSGRLQIREPPFEFPLGDIFPLRRRPFHNRWYPTPNSIGSMISGYFPNTSLADCVYYLHDLPFNQCQRPLAPCRTLSGRFAFTRTLQLRQGQLQYLVDRGRAVTAVAFVPEADRL